MAATGKLHIESSMKLMSSMKALDRMKSVCMRSMLRFKWVRSRLGIRHGWGGVLRKFGAVRTGSLTLVLVFSVRLAAAGGGGLEAGLP